MPLPAYAAAAVAGPGTGKLLVAGGTLWTADKKIWSERVDALDLAANRWDSLPALPAPHGDAACLVLGGNVTILGGGKDGAIADDRLVAARRRLAGGSKPCPASGPCAGPAQVHRRRRGGRRHSLSHGRLSRAGRSKAQARSTRTVWAWKPGATRWEERAPLPGLARFNPAVAVIGGKIYAAGGATLHRGPLENLDDIIAYDPAADRWSTVGKLPFPNRAASGVAVDGKLVVLGGYDTKFETTVSVFDPATGQTRAAGSISHALADARFAVIGKSILGVGGECGVKMRAPWTIEAKIG